MSEPSEPFPQSDTDTGVDTDELFDLLSNARRRRVLAVLQRADGDAATLEELAERVVARDTDDGSDDPEAAAIALHHVHLPKLADCGVIEYDARNGTVSYCGRPERDRLLELAVETAGDGS